MSKTILALVAAFGILIGTIVILGIQVASTYNQVVGYTTLYSAKVKSNEAEFDNMWKKISQQYQVANSQKDAFRQIFTEYAQARAGTGDQGSLMRWIKEAVPNIDTSAYKNLLNSIAGSRDSWTRNQNELVDISRQYNLYISKFPNNLVAMVFDWHAIDPKVITSTRTENSFATGKDDDVNLK